MRCLVLGLDVGGTSSRALVADLDGRVLGTGSAAGGNPQSHPVDEAVEQVLTAARSALGGLDPAEVRRTAVGLAGVSRFADPAVADRFDEGWRRLGLGGPVEVVGDCDVAFAAGTPAASGTVLVAGTGSIAARVEQHRVTGTAGGHGWLLGDEGSAFWLGREAVRAALRALDRAEAPGPLGRAVLDRWAPEPTDRRRALITAANAGPPIRLAELAPLVTAAAEDDPVAAEILRRAATLLAAAVADAGGDGPVVLAGGLLDGGPLDAAVRAELAERGRTDPRAAGPGAAGAAWLAARELVDDPAALHARLLP
ncbi:N-acetylglucosamine kinase [Saccharopolyspora cebuensis]|uniref:N-acetylglucosamine kinase n=1 Tax=Saccharopolyspora cebuensis TaxID=418759 RepID=A0ABV4CU66_9PSEU